MDLSATDQSQNDEEDEEEAAKRSRFRKRDSIGLYQDRKKSKLTFANAPDYVTFIPEEPYEDENNGTSFTFFINFFLFKLKFYSLSICTDKNR